MIYKKEELWKLGETLFEVVNGADGGGVGAGGGKGLYRDSEFMSM